MTKKSILFDGIKSGLLAFVICAVAVLVTALFGKWFCLSQTVLAVTGQVVEIVAVFLAVLLGLREGAYLPKALIAAVLFALLQIVCTLVAGGGFSLGKAALDLVIALVTAVIAALIKNRRG